MDWTEETAEAELLSSGSNASQKSSNSSREKQASEYDQSNDWQFKK